MSRDDHERFRRDYAPTFLQYLSERSEPGLRAAYELGRRAMAERLSVLDLARIHHVVLLDVLKSHRTADELEDIARAASEFLVEALATFEMAQRGFMELREAGAAQPQDRSQRQVTTEQATPRPPGRSAARTPRNVRPLKASQKTSGRLRGPVRRRLAARSGYRLVTLGAASRLDLGKLCPFRERAGYGGQAGGAGSRRDDLVGGTSASTGVPLRATRNRSPWRTRSISSEKRDLVSATPRTLPMGSVVIRSHSRPDVMQS